MDYQKIYDSLIQKAKERNNLEGYTENHHIIPISEGGSDEPENIVELTAREHYFAHLLLYKIEKTSSRVNALWAMMRESQGQSRFYPSSRIYEVLKEDRAEMMSKLQTGRKHVYHPETEEKRFVKGDTLKILLSKGWVLGSPNSTTKGRIGIHKPGTKIKKYVEEEELEQYLNDGWVEGLFKFKSSHSWDGSRKGKGNPTYGRKAVHNPETGDRKYVPKDEVNEYLSKGYIKGRGPNDGYK